MEAFRHLEQQPVMWHDDIRSRMLGYLPFLTMFLVCILWDLRIFCADRILWPGKLPYLI